MVETLGEITVAAQRNRMLKRVLRAHFGKGKVRVRGHSGTATIKIDATPPSIKNRRELESKVWDLINKNNIEIGSFGIKLQCLIAACCTSDRLCSNRHRGSDFAQHVLVLGLLP